MVKRDTFGRRGVDNLQIDDLRAHISRDLAADIRALLASDATFAGRKLAARDIADVINAAGHKVDVTDKAATVADLQSHEVFLGVCATHGAGDIPTNILPLAETLQRERPDLSGRRYGVIALGDMTYQDTFCGGGKKVDRVFELCGARRIGDRLEVDASSQPLPDEEALSWVEDWKALV